MSTLQAQSEHQFANIRCPKCGAFGVIAWDQGGAQPSLVSLSNGFYERVATKKPYAIELVCHECGATQPEAPLN